MFSSGYRSPQRAKRIKRAHGPESGWNAYYAITRDQAGSDSNQPRIKLLNPQPKIQRTLEMTGLDTFFQIYPDLAAAVASF